MMIAPTMPPVLPVAGDQRYNSDPFSAPLKRKLSRRRLDRFIDPEGHMQENANYRRPPLPNGASTRLQASGREHSRGRQNSLRHVKNSQEVMRQRSTNRHNQDIAPDGNAGSREGRQFTVANVGNNGRIYLR